ncbi:Peptidoglycan-binding domain 1 protein [Fragilaria crotonensis]|nr:Peptidoglycan-binding domain 1 protein [Fragilaria crotonensis]
MKYMHYMKCSLLALIIATQYASHSVLATGGAFFTKAVASGDDDLTLVIGFSKGKDPIKLFVNETTDGAVSSAYNVSLGADKSIAVSFKITTQVASDGATFPWMIFVDGKARDAKTRRCSLRRARNLNSSRLTLLSSKRTYILSVRSQSGVKDAYKLEAFLVGDTNGDLKVDSSDIIKKEKTSGNCLTRANMGAVITPLDSQSSVVDIDIFLEDPGALSLVNLSETSFNSIQGPLSFALDGAEFEQAVADVTLFVNDVQVKSNLITVKSALLTASTNLKDGKNDIYLKAYDKIGRPLFLKKTIWAGDNIMTVKLVDAFTGLPFKKPATVTATLVDDVSITNQVVILSGDGSAAFSRLPYRTILLDLIGNNGEHGTAGGVPSATGTNLAVFSFVGPSVVNNNDFSKGLDGWDIAMNPIAASITQHIEDAGPPAGVRRRGLVDVVNNDLVLSTSDVGPVFARREFTTKPGVTEVRLRYRFVTLEIPGGSTNWREVLAPVSSTGDVISVVVSVANVRDSAYDSAVFVDFVEEISNDGLEDVKLEWSPDEGGLALTYKVVATLTKDVPVTLYWASGTGASDRIGGSFFTTIAVSGTAPGSHGPINVAGTLLEANPDSTTHIQATAGDGTSTYSITDVAVVAGANADISEVPTRMLDIVKDGLRAAGQPKGVITSTTRSPADQARAMFGNLINAGRTVAENVEQQRALYGGYGDMVIDVFVEKVIGLNLNGIINSRATIEAAMETKIKEVGPGNVSRHCGAETGISENIKPMVLT